MPGRRSVSAPRGLAWRPCSRACGHACRAPLHGAAGPAPGSPSGKCGCKRELGPASVSPTQSTASPKSGGDRGCVRVTPCSCPRQPSAASCPASLPQPRAPPAFRSLGHPQLSAASAAVSPGTMAGSWLAPPSPPASRSLHRRGHSLQLSRKRPGVLASPWAQPPQTHMHRHGPVVFSPLGVGGGTRWPGWPSSRLPCRGRPRPPSPTFQQQRGGSCTPGAGLQGHVHPRAFLRPRWAR